MLSFVKYFKNLNSATWSFSTILYIQTCLYTEYTDIFCYANLLSLYQSESLVSDYSHSTEELKCNGKHIGKLVGAKPITYAEQLMFFYYQIPGSLCQNAEINFHNMCLQYGEF